MNNSKILLILDGKVAKKVAKKLTQESYLNNDYYLVYYEDKLIENLKFAGNVNTFKIDPTSSYKMNRVLKVHFSSIIIALEKKAETLATIENIRSHKDYTQIILLDEWDLKTDDKNIYKIHTNDILSNKILDNLPNIPITASNIGLGMGEIMEVRVPFNSTFAHKNINSITQKDWKIVGLYRNDKLIIPKSQNIIEPDDRLLTIGNPTVLSQVYKTINQKHNDFPMPFGKNIYSIIDLKNNSEDDILNILDELLLLKNRLNGLDVIIRVINISTIDIINRITKKCDDRGFIIKYSFQNDSIINILDSDKLTYKIGLVTILSKQFKEDRALRKTLYQFNMPILKIGKTSIKNIKSINILLKNNSYYEEIGPTIFDIAKKLSIKLELLSVTTDDENYKDIISYYSSLSQTLSKNIIINEYQYSNPLSKIKLCKDFIQPIPLTKSSIDANMFSIISKDSDAISVYYMNNTILFIPINRC